MDITYLGHSSFKIKGKKATIVTDPFRSGAVGLKFPKVDADIVTISHDHDDHNAGEEVGGNPFVIRGPGEYEVKGVGVIGIPTFHDSEKGKLRGRNTVYALEVDGVHIAHLGDLGELLTQKEIEQLGEVDIVLIPTGGVVTITPKQVTELIAEIEPSIVIPMHYGREELDQKTFGELSVLGVFLKLMGVEEGSLPQSKFSITKDKLPDTMQVVVLE